MTSPPMCMPVIYYECVSSQVSANPGLVSATSTPCNVTLHTNIAFVVSESCSKRAVGATTEAHAGNLLPVERR